MFFHPADILLIPAILLAVWAQAKVRSAYARYSQVGTQTGLSGAEVAQRVMRDAGIDDARGGSGGPVCGLQCIPGELTDHYDPRDRVLRLSEAVYHGRSIAALGIAAHEVGHAIQHARLYGPLMLRTIVYPVCSFGSTLAFPLFLGGFFFSSGMFMQLGIMLYTFAVFFTVLTLPVEFNASSRALRALANGGYLTDDELRGARKVLNAAALTYVAAAATALLQLLRLILIARGRH